LVGCGHGREFSVHHQSETETEAHQTVHRVEQELHLVLEEHHDDKNIIFTRTFGPNRTILLCLENFSQTGYIIDGLIYFCKNIS